MLKIAVAQFDPVVGAFGANVKKIKEYYLLACSESEDAQVLLTPELGVCGYPPGDLIERPEFFELTDRSLDELALLTTHGDCALVVGHIAKNPQAVGCPAQNVVSVFEKGHRVFSQSKSLLPNYDVFDELRYFEPARTIQLWEYRGYRIALAICEDLWAGLLEGGRHFYRCDPVDEYQSQKADLVISISASPYEVGKFRKREKLHQEVAQRLQIPVIYVNTVGATDEILFDGGSFVLNGLGQLIGRLPFFAKAYGTVSVLGSGDPALTGFESFGRVGSDTEILASGLITGIREYFSRTGFETAMIGLSGGIDSSVVAVLAAQALGSKNVLGIAMPSQFSSTHSLTDAEKLARNLGIRFQVQSIKFQYAVVSRELAEGRGELATLALENLQSRLRGVILMTLSNHESALVLACGNKSELAMGYCTIYGDMVGALSPIGDVIKSRIYPLAQTLNLLFNQPIPEDCLTKVPSAELRPGQTDQDSLPPYDILDQILVDYLENNLPLVHLQKKYQKLIPNIQKIVRQVDLSEFKRRQAPPVLKISSKAFGVGRRIPISKEPLY